MSASVAAVLFDLDGTLADTLPDLAAAVDAARADLGLPPIGADVVRTYIGKGAHWLVARSLEHGAQPAPSAEDTEQALAIFSRHYVRCNGDQARLFPGVREGLAQFRAMGAKLAIVTNKEVAFVAPLLERVGLVDTFDLIVGGDTCVRCKPDPMPVLHACALLGVAPEQALFIGDSSNDVCAARAAGVPVLTVPYGYHAMDTETYESAPSVASIAAAAEWAAVREEQGGAGSTPRFA